LDRPRTSSQPTRRREPPEALATTLEPLLEELPEDLARQAFTHSSWADHRGESYERLAFLGDVVLSLALSTHIYPRFENFGAGRLTKLRAQSVSREACAQVARDIGVPERLERVAPSDTGQSAEALIASDRILASICEAVIGAAYLAFGWDRVAPAVVESFSEQIDEALANPVDFKSELQERLARHADTVDYEIESEDGPPHDRRFVALAVVRGEELGRGEGKTKKAAEQSAAERALDRLDEDAG
jgi:ribonuclease-3